jgi:PilZ domain
MKAEIADRTFEPQDGEEGPYCPLSYTYQAGERCCDGQGWTRDLSRTGCGIRGTIIPPTGTDIRVTLYLDDQDVPLSFEATVRWTVGVYFGVQFVDIPVEHYMRIRRYMWTALNEATKECTQDGGM